MRISSNRTLQDGDNGFDVFMDVATDAGGPRSIFDTLEQIAVALDANTSPGALLSDVDVALAHFGSAQALIGGRLNTIDEQTGANDDSLLTLEISRSKVEDLDYAEAITRFSQQQIALEAAQKSFAQIQSMSLFDYL